MWSAELPLGLCFNYEGTFQLHRLARSLTSNLFRHKTGWERDLCAGLNAMPGPLCVWVCVFIEEFSP